MLSPTLQDIIEGLQSKLSFSIHMATNIDEFKT